MATIRKQELHDERVVAEIELTRHEAKELRGEMANVTLFTEERAHVPARISLRGRNEATKYFLIPRQLRKDLNTMGSVSCQRIERPDKDIFVYVVYRDTKRESFLPAPS